MLQVRDLRKVSDLITATMQERDPKRKIAWRQSLIAPEGRMTMLLGGCEALLQQNGPWDRAGDSLSVLPMWSIHRTWSALGPWQLSYQPPPHGKS